MNSVYLIGVLALLLTGVLILILRPLKLKLGNFLIVPLLIGAIAIAYNYWGGWRGLQGYWQHQLLARRASQLLTSTSPENLIQQLKARLSVNPGSAQGWYLLGRMYANAKDWSKARDAFAHAHQLNANDELATINYIQSLWELNHQQFNHDIRHLLHQMLINHPGQPDALSMLAIDAFNQHAYTKAINYWQLLLAGASPGSPDAQALQQAIIKAQQLQHKL